ncbi:MAG: hypothetical protein HN348_01755, partial [Proteobacteria bacterium]|nr:hypothetical protein [Pseudomonadota bacterium]
MRFSLLAVIAVLAGCEIETGTLKFEVAPVVSIVQPEDDVEVAGGEEVFFLGLVSDDDDLSALDVRWTSDLDGDLYLGSPDADGYVEFATANLSEGTHVVTLIATDVNELTDQDTVLVVVDGEAGVPVLAVVAPLKGEEGVEDVEYEFIAEVIDDVDGPHDLVVELGSDLDGPICTLAYTADDLFSCEAVLQPGGHILTFTATDTEAKTAEKDHYFKVLKHTEVDDDLDGFSEEQGDCDDTDSDIYPGATELPNGLDDDCDGTIDEGTYLYDDDGDGFTELEGDCDDGDADVFPGNPELPDGKDNDCDGIVDEGTDLYDDDGDGWTEDAGDCDDNDARINPGTPEICHDGLDNDCSGIEDDEDALGCDVYFQDGDGDGYGVAEACLCDSDPANDFDADDGDDCDDSDATVYPGAIELPYDGVDNDCLDGDLLDADGDGYNSDLVGGTDCDDVNPDIHPNE